VQEIESRAIAAQQQISIVKTQIATKQRDIRLLQLTSSELGSLSKDTNVYEGVGKMYVLEDPFQLAKLKLTFRLCQVRAHSNRCRQ
jgi:chaperonin cofactor prefoldin